MNRSSEQFKEITYPLNDMSEIEAGVEHMIVTNGMPDSFKVSTIDGLSISGVYRGKS